MRVAVASRNGRTIAGHIGKCQEWIVYEVDASEDGAQPLVQQLELISLPKELVFHHYKDDAVHPLASCAAVIGASAGESFVSKMARRGIKVILTAEGEPEKAVIDYVKQQVIPPKPRPIGGLICKIRDAFSSE